MRGCTERFSVTESLTAFRLLFLIRGKPVHVSPGRQCPAEGIDLFSRVVGLYKKKKNMKLWMLAAWISHS